MVRESQIVHRRVEVCTLYSNFEFEPLNTDVIYQIQNNKNLCMILQTICKILYIGREKCV